MEKMIELVNSLVETIRRIQERLSKLEVQRKFYVTKENLKEFGRKIDLKIKELSENIKKIENEYKDVKSEIESRFYNIDEDLRLVKSQLTSLVNIEDFSRLNIEIFNIKAKIKEIEDNLLSLTSSLNKIHQIEENLGSIADKLSILSNKIESLDKVKDLDKLSKSVEEIKYSLDLLASKTSNLEKEYEEIINKLSEIENDTISSILEDIQNIKSSYEEGMKSIKEEIGELSYLKNISTFDIEKIKRIPNTDEIYKRLQEIENKTQLLNSIINELSRIIYELRGNVSKIATSQAKIDRFEKDLGMLENNYKSLTVSLDNLKREVRDLKDIVLVTAKQNEKLEKKILQLETKIKIENIEEVLDAFERVKLLEEDIRNLKQLLSKYSFPMEPEKEVILKVKQLENAIKRLYEQQNTILYSLNEKLAKIEKMLNR